MSMLYAGSTWAEVESIFRVAGTELPFEKSTFLRWQKSKLTPAILKVRNRSIDDALDQRRKKRMKVSIDATWISRRNSLGGRVTAFDVTDLQHKVPVGLIHCVFDRDKRYKKSTKDDDDDCLVHFVGSSKPYEGFGTDMICQNLKSYEFDGSAVIKDGDAEVGNVFQRNFPGCVEVRDCNHLIKNIPNHVK